MSYGVGNTQNMTLMRAMSDRDNMSSASNMARDLMSMLNPQMIMNFLMQMLQMVMAAFSG
jgi:hypothetical protein